MVSVSGLILNIVYLLIHKFKKDKVYQRKSQIVLKKMLLMTDLDNELKRRKKEDVFLRN